MDEVKIQAYLRAFAVLAETQPGTPGFEIEQKTVDTLWDSLTIEEKAEAHQQAAPYRARLNQGRRS